MEIDNNKNSQNSDQDDDPTLELEPLSLEACTEMMISDDAPAQEAEEPISLDDASLIKELREELKFRDEINTVLQHGIDLQREKCHQLAEQVASLEKTNEKLSNKLERSRQKITKTKRKLAKAKDSEQALLINLKKLSTSDAANTAPNDQTAAVEELRNENLQLSSAISGLEAKFESALRNTDLLETRVSEAGERNEKLLAKLKLRNAQIADYENQLAASQHASSAPGQTSKDRAPAARLVQENLTEDRWVLVGLDGIVSDTYIVGDGIVTIGSSPDSDIQIDSKFISRHHAQLVKTHGGCVLGDLNSTNGTFINSRRINKRVLRANDIVTIGKHRFRYEKRSAK